MRLRTDSVLFSVLWLAPLVVAAQANLTNVRDIHETVAGDVAGDTHHGEEIDALEPGVDTSATTPVSPIRDAEETGEDDAFASEIETVADVSRSQSNGYVMDRLELGRTEITGNQELPKVLYIVPWQKAGPGDLLGRPVNSLLDEVLAPIDRDEFVRDVGYYDELHSGFDDGPE